MKSLIVGMLLAVSTPTMALAGSAGFEGSGAQSCPEFSKMIAADPKAERAFFVWAQGFLSGFNYAWVASGKTQQHKIDGDDAAQMASIRKVCNANPLMLYGDAVVMTWMTLPWEPAPH